MDLSGYDTTKSDPNVMPTLKEMFGKYGKTVYSYILKKTGNRNVAKEMTKQVFFEMYHNLRSAKPTDSMEMILLGLADVKIAGAGYVDSASDSPKMDFGRHDDLKQAIADLNRLTVQQKETSEIYPDVAESGSRYDDIAQAVAELNRLAAQHGRNASDGKDVTEPQTQPDVPVEIKSEPEQVICQGPEIEYESEQLSAAVLESTCKEEKKGLDGGWIAVIAIAGAVGTFFMMCLFLGLDQHNSITDTAKWIWDQISSWFHTIG